jgi:7-cyano-7-deazaguanine synthase
MRWTELALISTTFAIMAEVQDALADNVGPVRFHMPFRFWSKALVVQEAVRLGVAIGRTFSCQLLSDTPCGACPNCVERLNAIEANRGAA